MSHDTRQRLIDVARELFWRKGFRGTSVAEILEVADRLPEDLDREALSRFVLATMEGGVMQAGTHRSIEPFDDSVDQLRRYVDGLVATAAEARSEDS